MTARREDTGAWRGGDSPQICMKAANGSSTKINQSEISLSGGNGCKWKFELRVLFLFLRPDEGSGAPS